MLKIPFIVKFVLKNIQRNIRRYKIMFLSLMVGHALILWPLTFNRSGHDQMIHEITKTFIGNFQLSKKELFDERSGAVRSHHYIKEEKIKLSEEMVPRVLGTVFISGNESSRGVLLVGVDEVKEKKWGSLPLAIKEGNFVDHTFVGGLVIGKSLAKLLKLKLQDKVIVMGQAIDGSLANELFTVTGLFDVGGGALESSLILTDRVSAQNFLSLPQGAFHTLTFFNAIPEKEAKEMAKNFFGDNFLLKSWAELSPDVALSVDTMTALIFFIVAIIIFVVSFGAASTLFISFMEREKEFKTLKTIGVTPRWVVTALFVEVLFLIVSALLLSNLFSLAVNIFFGYVPISLSLFTGGKGILLGGLMLNTDVYFKIYPSFYLWTSLAMILALLLAIFYPLMRLVIKEK